MTNPVIPPEQITAMKSELEDALYSVIPEHVTFAKINAVVERIDALIELRVFAALEELSNAFKQNMGQ